MPRARSTNDSSLAILEKRAAAAHELADLLKPGVRVVLTTHVNADGDGTGSEVALWHLLNARGIETAITNPTPFPRRYQFLIEGYERADQTASAVRHVDKADVVVVLDIADLGRLGHLARRIEQCGVPVACIDHHVSAGSLPAGPRLIDAAACATGELVYDFAHAVGWSLNAEIARALYVAILTDTGGFRFSNTSARSLRIAAELLDHGAEPEHIYREVYASEPEGRVRMLSEVVDTLVVEPELGLAWVTVPPGALERYGLDADHLEGVVELPRSIENVRLGMLFRPLANGRIKISFRTVGNVNAAALAEQFGGGGHLKAAGASVAGDISEVQDKVLQVARAMLREHPES